jgi:hypothetical protein
VRASSFCLPRPPRGAVTLCGGRQPGVASSRLEQQVVDLELNLQDRDDDLAAARAANRELMAQLNRGQGVPSHHD